MHFIFYYFSNKTYLKPTKASTLKLVVMCEKARKQVRFRPTETLKFDSVELFFFPTPRIIPEKHDQSKLGSRA